MSLHSSSDAHQLSNGRDPLTNSHCYVPAASRSTSSTPSKMKLVNPHILSWFTRNTG